MSELALRRQIREQEADSKSIFGFWVYLMTDCVLFATLFATFCVLRNETFGGPGGSDLFSMPFVLMETLALLTSSFTCGLGLLAARHGLKKQVMILFGITFLLGVFFLTMEISEFRHLVQEGNSWRRSGFLSAFFTLVATHGLHITAGLLWMATLMVRVARAGIGRTGLRQLTMLSLFWHFLDIIWIFIFTIVYLMGKAGV
jgi:cytochrome o ubiquinol oxidase subunit III